MARRASWSLQLQRIYSKGWQAYVDGKSVDNNPYKPNHNSGNLQRQRTTYWYMGYQAAEAASKETEQCPTPPNDEPSSTKN